MAWWKYCKKSCTSQWTFSGSTYFCAFYAQIKNTERLISGILKIKYVNLLKICKITTTKTRLGNFKIKSTFADKLSTKLHPWKCIVFTIWITQNDYVTMVIGLQDRTATICAMIGKDELYLQLMLKWEISRVWNCITRCWRCWHLAADNERVKTITVGMDLTP